MTPSLKNLRISRDWVIALGFGTLAALFRFWNLGLPKGKIFDEIYYAADANSLLLSGVEVDAQSGQGGFIAHPPVGKWRSSTSHVEDIEYICLQLVPSM